MAIHPKSILVYLALLNFLYVPIKFGSGCFRYWGDNWYVAFTVLIAAFGLWTGKWWSDITAIILSTPLVYNFVFEFLKVFGYLANNEEETYKLVKPDEWYGFHIQNYPEQTGQIVLAAVILCYAATCIAFKIVTKSRVLS
ncbi:MAG: hypothetical protein M3209_15290 [Acidobacteriota bacterium]|nr:hypothetical protein [Acidobacteriota bacterium]